MSSQTSQREAAESPNDTVTITISREDAGRLANYIDPGSILMAQIRVQEACRKALEGER